MKGTQAPVGVGDTVSSRQQVEAPRGRPGAAADAEARAAQLGQQYRLRLYVAGPTPRSTRAIVNARRICEQYLRGRYALEVIDLYQQPALAAEDQIVAAPTLLRMRPLPLRRLIGDLSDRARVLVGLGLVPAT
jgi:circadian clock protein KaiB